MKKTTVEFNNNELIISGDITQDTVMSVLEKSLNQLPKGGSLKVNLKAVERCDSTSVAFIMALLRGSRLRQLTIEFCHLPKQMLQISKVCALENILPIAET